MDTPIEFTLKNWSRTYIICPILNKNKYVSHLMQLFCKVHTDWLGLCKVHAESARTHSDSAESVRSPHGQVGHCKLLEIWCDRLRQYGVGWKDEPNIVYLSIVFVEPTQHPIPGELGVDGAANTIKGPVSVTCRVRLLKDVVKCSNKTSWNPWQGSQCLLH